MSDSFFEKLRSKLSTDRLRTESDVATFLSSFVPAITCQPSHEKSHLEVRSDGGSLEVSGFLPYPSSCDALVAIAEGISDLRIRFNLSPLISRSHTTRFIRCLNQIHGRDQPDKGSESAHVWEPDDPIHVLLEDRGAVLCQAGDGYLAWASPEELEKTLEAQSIVESPGLDFALPFLEWPEIVEEWIGVPYVWGGTGKEGVDCSGLVMRLYQEAGYQIPRDSQQQMLIGTWVEVRDPIDSLRDGDLLFFTHDDGRLGHVAISLGGMKVFHAQEGGVCIFSLNPEDEDYDSYRAKHFVFAKRLLEPY